MNKKGTLIWIAPECPLPANSGGRMATWKKIEYTAPRYDILFFGICDDSYEMDEISEMEKKCKGVYLYPREKNVSVFIKSIFYPYPAVSRWNKCMTSDISRCISKYNVHCIIVEYPQMVGVIASDDQKKVKIIINQQNIEWKTGLNIAKGIANPIKKLVFVAVSLQQKRYEESLYKSENISAYTFVSIDDKSYFEKNYGKSNTYLIPIGSEILKNESVISKNNHTAVFVGKMSYEPNKEAAIWLLKDIWPVVMKEISDAKLYIVGKDPSDEIVLLAKSMKNVIVTGTVKSTEKYYNMSNLVLVPVKHGGGVKVKLLEALGHGKVVITTSKGLEGTIIKDGCHVLAADDNDFANACIDVMNNPKNYKHLAENGLALMKDHYSWNTIASRFVEVIAGVCRD